MIVPLRGTDSFEHVAAPWTVAAAARSGHPRHYAVVESIAQSGGLFLLEQETGYARFCAERVTTAAHSEDPTRMRADGHPVHVSANAMIVAFAVGREPRMGHARDGRGERDFDAGCHTAGWEGMDHEDSGKVHSPGAVPTAAAPAAFVGDRQELDMDCSSVCACGRMHSEMLPLMTCSVGRGRRGYSEEYSFERRGMLVGRMWEQNGHDDQRKSDGRMGAHDSGSETSGAEARGTKYVLVAAVARCVGVVGKAASVAVGGTTAVPETMQKPVGPVARELPRAKRRRSS